MNNENQDKKKNPYYVTEEDILESYKNNMSPSGQRNVISNLLLFLATTPLNIILILGLTAALAYLAGAHQFVAININLAILLAILFYIPITSLLYIGASCHILAIVLGHVELFKYKKHPRRKTIITALVFGYFMLATGMFIASQFYEYKNSPEFIEQKERFESILKERNLGNAQ